MMRNFSFLLVLLSFTANAQIPWALSFGEAIETAKKSGKKVLLECYHPECSHCKVLNVNLEDSTVSSLINTDFIGFKIDLSKGRDVKILDSLHFNVQTYPVLIFFDQDARPYNFLEPAEKISILISQLLETKDSDVTTKPANNTNDLARKAQFYFLQQKLIENDTLAEELYTSFGPSQIETAYSWMVFKRCVFGSENSMYAYWIAHRSTAINYEENQANVDEVIYSKLHNMRRHLLKYAQRIAPENISKLKEHLTLLGSDKRKIATISWDVEMAYYLNNNLIAEAKAFSDSIRLIFPDHNALLTIFQFINSHSNTDAFFDYFKKHEAGLSERVLSDREKKIFNEESAIFYGRHGEKAVCLEKIKLAEQFGSKPEKIADITSRFCQ